MTLEQSNQSGQKHLIKCRCILPQFKRRRSPPLHHFVVFSLLDANDNIVVKFAKCNNCGTIHKVTGLCQSEIMLGKEHMRSVRTIEEIKASLPDKLVGILESNHADYASFEAAEFIIENNRWGDRVVLMTDEEAGVIQGKYVRILTNSLFKVDTITSDAFATEEND